MNYGTFKRRAFVRELQKEAEEMQLKAEAKKAKTKSKKDSGNEE